MTDCAWYLIHTRPRQELIALKNLERQGYLCYLPRLRFEKIRRRQLVAVDEPLFARYLFIRLASAGEGLSWAPIRSTRGVAQLVRFGEHPARADDALVAHLQERERGKPVEKLFLAGDKVTITQGPFAGLEAIYQSDDAQERSIILLEIMSRAARLRIETSSLTPARDLIAS
jgi:transcriptional antiterminator RfaH